MNYIANLNIYIETERETTQTTERLAALHNKLHQEAEKIRKWKTKTDLELNDKVFKNQIINKTLNNYLLVYNLFKVLFL